MTWWYISGYEDLTCIAPPATHSNAVPGEASDAGPDRDKPGCDMILKLYLGAGLALSNINKATSLLPFSYRRLLNRNIICSWNFIVDKSFFTSTQLCLIFSLVTLQQ